MLSHCGCRRAWWWGGGEDLSAAGTAGPETYDLSQRSITAMLAAKNNPRSPPFGSSSRRL